MRKLLAVLVLFLTAIPGYSQQGNTTTIAFNGPPTGSCAFTMMANDTTNGNLYFCDATNAWKLLSTGSVPTTRTISTTLPLTGGGDLSANRTFDINNFGGDAGVGGTKGAVPAPAAGDAAAGKFLAAGGGWSVPPQGTVTATPFQLGLNRGSNLAPPFAAAYTVSHWTEGAGSMAINYTGANSFTPTVPLAIVSGQTYQVDITCSAYTSGDLTVSLGGVTTQQAGPCSVAL